LFHSRVLFIHKQNFQALILGISKIKISCCDCKLLEVINESFRYFDLCQPDFGFASQKCWQKIGKE
jgi:hypothetical protein